MVENTITKISKGYRDYTDKYFLRSKTILESDGINPIVRYQVFARKPGTVQGVDEAVDFIREAAGEKVKRYALKNGQSYQACEPLMKLEGRVQDLIDLETVYLGIISGGLTGEIDMQDVRENARQIVQSAKGKPVIYFGARHFHPSLDADIAKICFEEGFQGTSTDIGAKAWNAKGQGTIPHALILTYAAYMQEQGIRGNPTVEAAKAFDKHMLKEIPRIVLIDTFNNEVIDSIETAKQLKNLSAVRIDTCGENYSQGSQEIILTDSLKKQVPQKYLQGKGVTIASVWALKEALIANGFPNIGVVVSSGFNAEKINAFMQAEKAFQDFYGLPLFDSIGTGSIANPVMATSDIVAYYSEKKGEWQALSKAGRKEILTNRLEEVK